MDEQNEQRLQAYLSLIQQLLTCPSGEENDILNRHLELVDGGFVQVCEQVAAQLQQKGSKAIIRVDKPKQRYANSLKNPST